jgi:hypothetical protein
MGAIVVLLMFCAMCVWAANWFIKDMMEETKRNKELGPTEHPTKYIGPEDEPRWEVYSRNIGRRY